MATTSLVLALTTPYETPAIRLARYARYTGRRQARQAPTSTIAALRERLILPLLRAIVEFAARAAPSQARKTAAAELTMAGSRMNPTMFLGIRTLLMFGMPGAGRAVRASATARST